MCDGSRDTRFSSRALKRFTTSKGRSQMSTHPIGSGKVVQWQTRSPGSGVPLTNVGIVTGERFGKLALTDLNGAELLLDEKWLTKVHDSDDDDNDELIRKALEPKTRQKASRYAIRRLNPHVSTRDKAVVFCKWLEAHFDVCQLRAGSGIVEVAGGNGILAFELSNRFDVPVTIVDPRAIDGGQLRKLRQKWRRHPRALRNPAHLRLCFSRDVWDPLFLSRDQRLNALQDNEAMSSSLTWDRRGLHSHEAERSSAALAGDAEDRHEDEQTDDESKHGLQQHPSSGDCPVGYSNNDHTSVVSCSPDCIDQILQRASCVVAMHPDQATSEAIDFALHRRKPFAVVPCCVYALDLKLIIASFILPCIFMHSRACLVLLCRHQPFCDVSTNGTNDSKTDVVPNCLTYSADHSDRLQYTPDGIPQQSFLVPICCACMRWPYRWHNTQTIRYAKEFPTRRLLDGTAVRTYEQFLEWLTQKAPHQVERASLPIPGKNTVLFSTGC